MIRKARPKTGTSVAPAIIPCSCSTSSATWSGAPYPNYVFKHEGQWVLMYSAGTMTEGHSAIAFADNPGGPYTNKQILISRNNIEHDVIGGLENLSFMDVQGAVRLNEPYVAYQSDGVDEIVYPVKQVGSTIHFNHPLRHGYSSTAKLAHFGKTALALKYVWQLSDRSWAGYATCQSMTPYLREYVAQMKAPDLTGPWEFDQKAVAFKPWDLWHLHSCENPAPLLDATGLFQ